MFKRGLSHVEIIFSFVIFIGFLIFALFFFNPFQIDVTDEAAIAYALSAIEANVSTDVFVYSLVYDPASVGGPIIDIPLNLPLSHNVRVERYDTVRIDADRAGSNIIIDTNLLSGGPISNDAISHEAESLAATFTGTYIVEPGGGGPGCGCASPSNTQCASLNELTPAEEIAGGSMRIDSFSGTSGQYDIDVVYCDEFDDFIPDEYTLIIDTGLTTVSYPWMSPPGGPPSTNIWTTQQITAEILQGSTITLDVVASEGGTHGRVDYIAFQGTGVSATPPTAPQGFLTIYSSEDFVSIPVGSSDGTPTHTLSSSDNTELISHQRFTAFKDAYDLDYQQVKTDLGISPRSNFNAALMLNTGEQVIAERQIPENIEVIVERKRVKVIRDDGEIVFGDIIVTLW